MIFLHNLFQKSIQTFLLMTGATVAFSCGRIPEPVDASKDIPAKPDIDVAEQILIEPDADAKGLLGRRVAKRPKGGYEILERAPGCEVQYRHKGSIYDKRVTGTMENLAGFSANFGAIANLSAKYQNRFRSVSLVHNESIIEADLSGDCGEDVIVSVKVGTGRREYQYKKLKSAEGEAGWQTVGGGGGASSAEAQEYSIEWHVPQAWSFAVGKFSSKEQAALSIRMPERLRDGEEFSPEITTGDRSMYLIVASCWGENACAILRPCSDIPVELVAANRTMKLKPMRARALEGEDSREKFVVYGFMNQKELQKMNIPNGAVSPAEAAAFVESIPERIKAEGIPSRRWASEEFGYVIEGKPVPDLIEQVEESGDASRKNNRKEKHK